MAWRQIGNKPLSEPMLTWFINACMRYYGEMSLTANKHKSNERNTSWAKEKCISEKKQVFEITAKQSKFE